MGINLTQTTIARPVTLPATAVAYGDANNTIFGDPNLMFYDGFSFNITNSSMLVEGVRLWGTGLIDSTNGIFTTQYGQTGISCNSNDYFISAGSGNSIIFGLGPVAGFTKILDNLYFSNAEQAITGAGIRFNVATNELEICKDGINWLTII